MMYSGDIDYLTADKTFFLVHALYDVLHNYTDGDNTLSSREIAEILCDDYGIYRRGKNDEPVPLVTKKITHKLLEMRDVDSRINCTPVKTNRKHINKADENGISLAGKPVYEYKDWWIEHEFSDAELIHLINLQIFSRFSKYEDSKKLVEKLKGLAGRNFSKRTRFAIPLTGSGGEHSSRFNPQFFMNVEYINEAIVKGKQISFLFLKHELDEATYRLTVTSKPERNVVTPYALVMKNARYYMICSHETGSTAYHYRLDYMRDIIVLDGKNGNEDKPARSKDDIPLLENDINYTRYLDEHIYMFGGKSVRAYFLADKEIITHILDWFGERATFDKGTTKDNMLVHVVVNEDAMVFWALQYGKYVQILEPESLLNKVTDAVADMHKKYFGCLQPCCIT